MPGYQSISWAASWLQTDVETLTEFERKGWIKTVEKNGLVFLAGDQRYRAKFILHLRTKMGLSDEQIDLVLAEQRPPYSAADAERILRERGQPVGGGSSRRARGKH